MLASARNSLPEEPAVKKGIVILLVVVALIVLISPGIVGRIAERSVDENLQWAAEKNEDIVVTSERFDRGWFSSAGQHRVEIRDPAAQKTLLGLVGIEDTDGFPALIIDTRLDHGLIPVASMARDKGSLVPGLGSAVSTMHIEYPDGETFPLPGTIYSDIGLTGETRSRYLAEPGSHEAAGARAAWGEVDIEVTTDPSSQGVIFAGLVDSFTIVANSDTLLVGKTTFAGEQTPSKFGIAVGDVEIHIESVAVEEAGADMVGFGPLSFQGTSHIDGERLNGDAEMNLSAIPVPGYGEMGLAIGLRYTGIDGAAAARLINTLDSVDDNISTQQLLPLVDDDLQQLVAAGFEIHFDQFDFDLPQGPVTSTMRFTLAGSDVDDFVWTSILMDLDAEAELKVAAEFVDMAMAMNPQAAAVVGMGFLRKIGDVYEMRAEYTKGLLTVNGAPIPIPAFQ
jgi:uncharacterized protein YdgA (DUF945 family)